VDSGWVLGPRGERFFESRVEAEKAVARLKVVMRETLIQSSNDSRFCFTVRELDEADAASGWNALEEFYLYSSLFTVFESPLLAFRNSGLRTACTGRSGSSPSIRLQ
jgi:hypothetical protein